MTPELAEKVHTLLEQRRVLLVDGQAEALVVGDSGPHDVVAVLSEVACTCIAAGRGRLCSHALAAMVAWAEAGAA